MHCDISVVQGIKRTENGMVRCNYHCLNPDKHKCSGAMYSSQQKPTYPIIPVDTVITELQSNRQRARGKQASNFNKLFTENAVSLYGKTTDSCYIPCCMVRLQTAVTDSCYTACGELCGKTTAVASHAVW